MMPTPEKPSLLDTPLKRWFPLNVETLLVVLLLAVAVVSRFYDLGARTMSHDEVNHVVPSFSLYSGNGYKYDPMSHGPFQYHMMALSYALFGDNDFTTRIPVAVFSIAALVVVLFAFRSYLGRTGALVAGVLIIISPLMLFYGRYSRNESYIVLWGILTIYSILRYLERGEAWALFLFTAVNALHFTDKATSYMFAAEEFLFLGAYFVDRVSRREWQSGRRRVFFLLGLALTVVMLAGAAGFYLSHKPPADTAAESLAGTGTTTQVRTMIIVVSILAAGGVGTLVWSGVELVRGLGWAGIKSESRPGTGTTTPRAGTGTTTRAADLLILLGTLILPLSGAIPIKLMGFTPLDYTTTGMLRVAGVAAVLAAIGIALGLWWFGRKWLFHAALFFVPFIVLYSTFFTNPQGIVGGLVGALGYWTEQQDVARGGQPLYYYGLLMVPMYEFLSALGTVMAAGIATFARQWQSPVPRLPFENRDYHAGTGTTTLEPGLPRPVPRPGTGTTTLEPGLPRPVPRAGTGTASLEPGLPHQTGQPFARPPSESDHVPPVPVAALLVFWSVSSLAVFTYAGEKMPWLTIHIALPMILSTAWAIGWLVEAVPWGRVAACGVVPVPGRGGFRNYARLATLVLFGFLAVLTGRDAFRAAYINYDYPTEYLVYAHAAPDPKVLFGEIEELSIRTTGTTTDMVAAYDNQVRYPYWWYMRRYTSKIDFDVNPTRDLRRALVIAVGDENLTKLTPVVRQDYTEFAGMRLWWPNLDYWSLKWGTIESERTSTLQTEYAGTDTVMPAMNILGYLEYAWPHIKAFFTDSKVRSAVFQIWFNDDFTEWGALKNSTAYSLTDWGVSARMHYYIRKDIAAQLWPYGASAQAVITPVDPYADITTPASPDLVLGTAGSEPGQFQSPRAVAVAADGSLYVVDSMNDRIQHLSQDGEVLQIWGTPRAGTGTTMPADVSQGEAPGGTFNEPWGIAVAPDGSVYVADTWNYRIQKFTADGRFVTMWGFFGGAADAPEAFYGPRGLAVDPQGRVYIADTGNKRIVVFGPDGKYITQFGAPGMGLGELDEPVAVALDAAGNVYVTDTWNQRVQVFAPDPGGQVYTAIAEWPVDGWYGQSVENKPFIAVDATGNISVTDPELCRVITFSPGGQPVRVWDGCPAGTLLLPSGIASDGSGGLWVTNAGNGTLVHFKLETPNP